MVNPSKFLLLDKIPNSLLGHIHPSHLLRGGVLALEIVIVGQCEVFVCVDFVDFPPPP